MWGVSHYFWNIIHYKFFWKKNRHYSTLEITLSKQTFEEAWEENYALIRNRAYKLAKDDAHDLIQEVAVKAYKAYGKFDGNKFPNWINMIMSRAWWDMDKKNKRNIPTDFEEVIKQTLAISPSAESVVAARLFSPKMESALAKITPDQKKVMVMYAYGMEYWEIADALGVKIGTISSRINRARKILKEELTTV